MEFRGVIILCVEGMYVIWGHAAREGVNFFKGGVYIFFCEAAVGDGVHAYFGFCLCSVV